MQEQMLGLMSPVIQPPSTVLMHLDGDITDIYGAAVQLLNNGSDVAAASANLYMYSGSLARPGYTYSLTGKNAGYSRFYTTPVTPVPGSQLSNFTLDCWAYFLSGYESGVVKTLGGLWDATGTRSESWYFGRHSNNQIGLRFRNTASGSWTTFSTGINPNDNKWHHYALSVYGTNVLFFVDGVVRIKTNISRNNNNSDTFITGIGCGYDNTFATTDNLDYALASEFRWVAGTAVWKSGFVPPTTPYVQ